jgi:serine O-acetyltransferase
MFDHIRKDVRRCGETFRERVREIMLNPGMWAILGYRFRRRLYTAHMPCWLRWPFSLAACVVQLGIELATGIQLSAGAKVGPGLYIPHIGTIVVGSGCVLGKNCTLCHGTTLGHRGGGKNGKPTEKPIIGDRVYIGPGSFLLGPITVGEDSVIGASAVVTRSVPPRVVVAGNPARVLSRGGSFDLIRYPGMEQDPDRLASLFLAAPTQELNGSASNKAEAEGAIPSHARNGEVLCSPAR